MADRVIKHVSEWISTCDGSYIANYGNHIQRYDFALPYCMGKSILDAGCGIGYGSHHLARNSGTQVIGVDISAEAIGEATETFQRTNLR